MMRRISLQIILLLVLISFTVSAHAAVQPLFGTDSGYTVLENNVTSGAYIDTYVTDDINYEYEGYRGSQYSGYYIGTVLGENDKESVLEKLVRYYFDDPNYEIGTIGKVDNSIGGTSGALTYAIDSSTTTDEPEWIGGTWSLETPYMLEFYTVKTTNGFALYYLNPAEGSGTWWTGHIGGDGVDSISHFSAIYTGGGDTPPETAVPEPATLLLFGTGALGLAGVCRRKMKKQ